MGAWSNGRERIEPTGSGWTPTRRRVAVGVAAVTMLAGSCSSDDGSAAVPEDPTSSTIDADAVLGTPDPATGETLRIGYAWDGATAAVDTTEDLETAQASVEYVNEYLGGIAGQRVELVPCSSDQTPAGAGACANQFIVEEVPVVLNANTGQAAGFFEPLATAGVPIFAAGADPRNAGVTVLSNSVLALAAGPAQVLADAGVTRAAIIGIDVPAASAALKTSATLFYEEVGIEPDVILIPPDTPDMAPHIQAALTKDPGGISVVGDPVFCAKAMAGIAFTAFSGEIAIIPQCMDDNIRENATNLEGVHTVTTFNSDPTTEEFQLFQAVMEKYAGSDAETGGSNAASYQVVVGFARAMQALTGEVTAASVRAALESMPATPMPLAQGLTFQCNGTRVPTFPMFCSNDVYQTVLDAQGNPRDFEVLNGDSLMDLGA